jgi:hypothetical protein
MSEAHVNEMTRYLAEEKTDERKLEGLIFLGGD